MNKRKSRIITLNGIVLDRPGTADEPEKQDTKLLLDAIRAEKHLLEL